MYLSLLALPILLSWAASAAPTYAHTAAIHAPSDPALCLTAHGAEDSALNEVSLRVTWSPCLPIDDARIGRQRWAIPTDSTSPDSTSPAALRTNRHYCLHMPPIDSLAGHAQHPVLGWCRRSEQSWMQRPDGQLGFRGRGCLGLGRVARMRDGSALDIEVRLVDCEPVETGHQLGEYQPTEILASGVH